MKHKDGKKKPVEPSYKEPMRPKKPNSNSDKKMMDGKMKKRK
jgi:hypothetical protein